MKGHLQHLSNNYNENAVLNRCIRNYNRNNKITSILKGDELVGKRCFIIGGGESINSLDLNRLNNEIVITINICFIKYRKSQYNYMMDTDLYDRIKSGKLNERHGIDVNRLWDEYSGTRIYLCPIEYKDFGPEVYVIQRIREIDVSKSIVNGIHGADNSGYGALMLSVALGCREIYLLGYDMKAIEKTHWHNGYDDRNINQFNVKLSEYRMGLNAIAPRLKNDGVRVFNCSLISDLKCFEYRNYNEVLNESNI